jgi:Excalibur calcium-binding domain
MRTRALAVLVVLAASLSAAVSQSPSAPVRVPAPWKSCKQVHSRYPHGVGKLHAHDSTTGTPVTSFRRSTKLYNLAMKYNRGLDRDRDGIVCEQA